MLYLPNTHNNAGAKEDYKSKKYKNKVQTYELLLGQTGKHLFILGNSAHSPSLSVRLSLSLPPPYPHLFLEDDMGDPDVTFHWPMVSGKGLDWCALPMPLLLKTPVSNSASKTHMRKRADRQQHHHHSHLTNSQLYLKNFFFLS